MTAVAGATLVPSRVTTSPSTSTSPASMSSSHLRRLATPDWASSFCSRTSPSSSVSIGGRRLDGHLGLGGRHRGDGLLEVGVVHVRHEGSELGQLVERGHADAL